MTQEQNSKEILEKVLRNIVSGMVTAPMPTATELMRAALALAALDDSISSSMTNRLRGIINGEGSERWYGRL